MLRTVVGKRLDEGLDRERAVEPHLEQAHLLAPLDQCRPPLRPRRRRSPSSRSRVRRPVRPRSRTGDTGGRPAWRTGPCASGRSAAPRRRTDCTPRAPGRTRPGSGPCRAAPAGPDSGPAAGTRSMHGSIDHRPDVVRFELLDLVHFVRERNPSKKCRNGTRASSVAAVRNHGHVLDLLHRVRRQHRPAATARRHHVAVVAENRQGVRGQACGP